MRRSRPPQQTPGGKAARPDAPTHPFRLSPAQAEIGHEYALRLARRLNAYQGVTAKATRSRRDPLQMSVGAQVMPGPVPVGLRVHVWPRHGDGALSWYRARPLLGRAIFQYVRPVTELDPLAADLVASLHRRTAASLTGTQS
ncbi:hypothetical protein [Actinomadura rudentiformis]|uniref:Uncharacterized protein n=1 Tax=Actinomadura rudentiformis TaxID=359158 RepID=A0A6H9Z5E1_9ACTN|nr:hypothetical protein [Actinomadura rudentiformis]KAB2350202.1 hypothetical protein F8566_10450 [Actinomadura rudentiformis]